MWPKPLIVAFERGYNALIGVRPVDITSWADFKQVCRQLKRPEAREVYETIVLDTVSIAYSLCEKYILNREGVQQIGEVGYGRGWNMLKDEFEGTLRELTQLGYALVLIAHSKNKTTEYTDEEGNALTAYAPDLPNAAYQICNRMVDVIGYIGVEYDLKTGESHRYLYTRGTPTIFAGSRYKYLKPRIELSYKNLVDAIADAMKKEAEETGTSVITSSEQNYEFQSEQVPFEDLMADAKQTWIALVEKAKSKDEESAAVFVNEMNNIVKKAFGRDFKLSQATSSQRDMVEVALVELKELL